MKSKESTVLLFLTHPASNHNKKKRRNDVTTGNAAEVAAIALFLFLCCDNKLGKRDYNPDKQQAVFVTSDLSLHECPIQKESLHSLNLSIKHG
jgi:hypothetical protein